MLFVHLTSLVTLVVVAAVHAIVENKIRLDGDIVLGGIFPMHEAQRGGKKVQDACGAVKEEKGVQRLEAMLFALDEINRSDRLLPNITLGALIIDSCSSDTYALEQSMEFVRSYMNQDMSEYKCENGKPPIYVPQKPISAVIGAASSGVSIMVANILRLFKIPQISYASTSTELSDKSRFEYFNRVVPPDNFQAQAMIEIIVALGWKYVSTVAVEGDYGEKGIASFISNSKDTGICIALTEKILRNAKSEDFDNIIHRLKEKRARAVVLFVDEDNTRKLLQASIRANITEYFIWVGSDSWGAKAYPVRDHEYAAEGAITILPHRTPIPEFDKYYTNLRPYMTSDETTCNSTEYQRNTLVSLINCRDIWFREFWAQHHKCTFVTNATNRGWCTGKEVLSNYEQEGLVPFVMEAVYAAAYAIHNIIADICGVNPFYLCEELRPAPTGLQLLKYLRNVSFIGRQGREIRFNEDGDAFGSYNIYQYQKREDGKYDYLQIGSWNEGLNLDISNFRWRDTDENRIPKSVCSDDCPPGYIRNFQDQCCWSCSPCRTDSYVYNDTCMACEPGYGPSVNHSTCVKLRPTIVGWTNPWVLAPLIFSALGIVTTIFTAIVFFVYNNTPVIRASGRELCYVLLFGFLLCYAMPFLILARPTNVRCGALRVGLGLCLNICYSAILTKTNRISRIFHGVMHSKQIIPYISSVAQISISLGLSSIQLLGSLVWLALEFPGVREIYKYPSAVILTCKASTYSFALSLSYNIFLILLCTIYSFKTRKIPENFNEAKYIGFTMYSTCIIWLGFVPIYFGVNNDHKIQQSSVCMCLNLSATVALGCLFTPKVYLVLFQPYKNVRGHSHLQAFRRDMNVGPARTKTVQSINSKSPPSSVVAHRAPACTPLIQHVQPSVEETSIVTLYDFMPAASSVARPSSTPTPSPANVPEHHHQVLQQNGATTGGAPTIDNTITTTLTAITNTLTTASAGCAGVDVPGICELTFMGVRRASVEPVSMQKPSIEGPAVRRASIGTVHLGPDSVVRLENDYNDENNGKAGVEIERYSINSSSVGIDDGVTLMNEKSLDLDLDLDLDKKCLDLDNDSSVIEDTDDGNTEINYPKISSSCSPPTLKNNY